MLTPSSAYRQLQQGFPTLWWRDSLQPLLGGDQPLRLAIVYLIALTTAEAVTVLVEVQLGVALNMLLLFVILLHTAFTWDVPIHRLLLTLAFAPLIRIISLTLPLVGFPLVYWYFITSVPLFVAALVMMRILGVSLRPIRLRLVEIPGQVVVGVVAGIIFGFIEFMILRPTPLVVGDFDWRLFSIAAAILMISTGLLEELIFRRIMQDVAVRRLGEYPGIVFVATIFAVLHLGYQSAADIVFVFIVGLLLGYFVARTKTILGVTFAHGMTNIVLFLVLPFTVAGQMPLVPEIVETEMQALVQTLDELGFGRSDVLAVNISNPDELSAGQVIDPSRIGAARAQSLAESAPAAAAAVEISQVGDARGAAVEPEPSLAEASNEAIAVPVEPEGPEAEAAAQFRAVQSGARWLLPAVVGQLLFVGLLMARTFRKRQD